MPKKHRHTPRCIGKYGKTVGCRVTGELYEPLTAQQKVCASDFIAEEMSAPKGRWPGGRKQAVAVGLSRARKEC